MRIGLAARGRTRTIERGDATLANNSPPRRGVVSDCRPQARAWRADGSRGEGRLERCGRMSVALDHSSSPPSEFVANAQPDAVAHAQPNAFAYTQPNGFAHTQPNGFAHANSDGYGCDSTTRPHVVSYAHSHRTCRHTGDSPAYWWRRSQPLVPGLAVGRSRDTWWRGRAAGGKIGLAAPAAKRPIRRSLWVRRRVAALSVPVAHVWGHLIQRVGHDTELADGQECNLIQPPAGDFSPSLGNRLPSPRG